VRVSGRHHVTKCHLRKVSRTHGPSQQHVEKAYTLIVTEYRAKLALWEAWSRSSNWQQSDSSAFRGAKTWTELRMLPNGVVMSAFSVYTVAKLRVFSD
jgi:hypothetical protein